MTDTTLALQEDDRVPAYSRAVAALETKLGFCIERGAVKYKGSNGVRPATPAEKMMWNLLLETKLGQYGESLVTLNSEEERAKLVEDIVISFVDKVNEVVRGQQKRRNGRKVKEGE